MTRPTKRQRIANKLLLARQQQGVETVPCSYISTVSSPRVQDACPSTSSGAMQFTPPLNNGQIFELSEPLPDLRTDRPTESPEATPRHSHRKMRKKLCKKAQVKRVFGFKPENRAQTYLLWRIWRLTVTHGDDFIYNLSSIRVIPTRFRCVMYLDLKFCMDYRIPIDEIIWYLTSSCRRISWYLWFIDHAEPAPQDPISTWSAKFRRKCSNRHRFHLKFDDNFEANFNLVELQEQIIQHHNATFNTTVTSCLEKVVDDFRAWMHQNNLALIPADKNAGLCLVNKHDHDVAVLKVLNDRSQYHRVTTVQFEKAREEYYGKMAYLDRIYFNTGYFEFYETLFKKAAQFSGLYKMHKDYDTFPAVRPISSTCLKFNRTAASLLHYILQPCLLYIKDIILDSSHLLLLLANLRLDKDKTYALVKVDITSMYPTLKLADCFKHCLTMYNETRKNNPTNIGSQTLEQLLHLSLGYSYVEYNEQIYMQSQGIEQGNISSPIVANITAYKEVAHLFNRKEIVFYKRLLDDCLLVVDVGLIDMDDNWLENDIEHPYLSFTKEVSYSTINFLDVSIQLSPDNEICTTSYTKPHSKHLFLHYKSNHPKRIKNSLYYSVGLRIVRSCTDLKDRDRQLWELKDKFLARGYPLKLLESSFRDLMFLERLGTLRPKNSFFRDYLIIHEKEIARFFNLKKSEAGNTRNRNVGYLVWPYSKNHPNIGSAVNQCIRAHIQETSARNILQSLDIHLTHKVGKKLKMYFT